jgi:hypothetical protein
MARCRPVLTLAALGIVVGVLTPGPPAHAATGDDTSCGYNSDYVGVGAGARPYLDLFTARELSADGTSDLDGDGLGDVIQWTADPGLSTITARRGVTGAALWSHNARDFVGVIPMRVGSPARPGVVVEYYCPNGNLVSLHLKAYDGRTGTELWHWSAGGVYDNSLGFPITHGIPNRATTLRAAAGHASKFLVDGSNQGLIVISGADGAVTRIGGTNWHEPIGDADGDGIADVATFTAGSVTAWSSATGRSLWQRAVPSGGGIEPRADVNGDGVADLDVYSINNDESVQNVLLNGRTGTVVYSAKSDHLAAPIGDANRDGIIDYASFTALGTFGKSCGVRHVAYSGRNGAEIWRTTYLVNNTKCFAMVSGPAGDVDADGATDFFVQQQLDSGYANGRIINGHDGVLRTASPAGVPVQGAVDGAGADFARITGGATLRIAVVDGGTARPIWTFQRAESPPVTPEYLHAGALTADARAEVIVTGKYQSGQHHEAVVINGATGKALWRAYH